jgi:hypothetical protein
MNKALAEHGFDVIQSLNGLSRRSLGNDEIDNKQHQHSTFWAKVPFFPKARS